MCIEDNPGQLVKIKLDKSKKLWYNSYTKKKTKLKKQQEKNT